MRSAFFCRVVLICIVIGIGQAEGLADARIEVNLFQPIPELALKNGRIYKNVQIVSYATNSVSAKWDGGAGTIDYKLLPENIRVAAEANRPEKAPDNKSQRTSYKDYLKKHPAPTVKQSSVPRIDHTGISQGTAAASPHQQSKDGDEASNKKKESRRVELANEIAQHQSIMDRYERQNSAAKKSSGITADQYARTKAARDKAQAERDDLAR